MQRLKRKNEALKDKLDVAVRDNLETARLRMAAPAAADHATIHRNYTDELERLVRENASLKARVDAPAAADEALRRLEHKLEKARSKGSAAEAEVWQRASC